MARNYRCWPALLRLTLSSNVTASLFNSNQEIIQWQRASVLCRGAVHDRHDYLPTKFHPAWSGFLIFPDKALVSSLQVRLVLLRSSRSLIFCSFFLIRCWPPFFSSYIYRYSFAIQRVDSLKRYAVPQLDCASSATQQTRVGVMSPALSTLSPQTASAIILTSQTSSKSTPHKTSPSHTTTARMTSSWGARTGHSPLEQGSIACVYPAVQERDWYRRCALTLRVIIRWMGIRTVR